MMSIFIKICKPYWLVGALVILLTSWLVRTSIPTSWAVPFATPLVRAAVSWLLIPPQAFAAPRVVHAPKIEAGPASSTNWAGYVVTGPVGSVSEVTGSWVVPSVTCRTGETSYSAVWIGIDGDTSKTVEQIGTEADCAQGVPTY